MTHEDTEDNHNLNALIAFPFYAWCISIFANKIFDFPYPSLEKRELLLSGSPISPGIGAVKVDHLQLYKLILFEKFLHFGKFKDFPFPIFSPCFFLSFSLCSIIYK